MCIDKYRIIRFFLYFVILEVFALFMVPINFAGEKDSEHIGFSCLTDEYWQIWTMNLLDEKVRQVTKSSCDKKEPFWFNNGKRFIYRTSNAKLFVFDTVKGKETQLLKSLGNIFDPDLSTDNEYMVFTRFREDVLDNSDIWLFTFSDKTSKKLTNEPGLQYDPALSPDGKRIAFVSSSESKSHEIRVMDKDGRNRQRLTKNSFYNVLPNWSPDGDRIAFSSNMTGNFDIWVMDKNGNNKKRITVNKGLDTHPVWSTEGENIFFVSNRDKNMRIWMMKADGSDQRPLTPDEMKCSDPVWIKTLD
jgi:TolB protein